MANSKATEDALNGLHATLARKLMERIESGEATAADLNVARAFLKDNGIEAAAVPGSPLSQLGRSVTDNLPFTDNSGSTYQ